MTNCCRGIAVNGDGSRAFHHSRACARNKNQEFPGTYQTFVYLLEPSHCHKFREQEQLQLPWFADLSSDAQIILHSLTHSKSGSNLGLRTLCNREVSAA